MTARKRKPNRASEFRTIAQRDAGRHLPVLQSIFARTEIPATYGDCIAQGLAIDRPCPHANCRHSLLAEISHKGAVRLRSDRLNRQYSCALHESKEGLSLAQVGERLGVTRERVRQIETIALAKFNAAMEKLT